MEEQPMREYCDVSIDVPWGHVVGRWYGNRQLRPILALHGWLDNLGTWDTLVPLLPPHISVLCLDLPGHGQSTHYPKGIRYHMIDYVHIIIRVMKKYNWQRISLMAHSMGSIVCFLYAALFPSTVDLLIQIDVVKPYLYPVRDEIKFLALSIEKLLIEDERAEKLERQEPPSYTFAELARILHESAKSVDLENCKYILNRNITKSTKDSNKYYYSRDGKLKFYQEFTATPALSLELAKRIRNVPILVVKGMNSPYIDEDSDAVLGVLREQNMDFEFHTIRGTHHVHLNNAVAVAAVLNPFIHQHRPVTQNDEETVESRNLTRCDISKL